ncbi:pyridoxamine 5'-phosphate oxidase family protein [Bordetella avium]|uniref:Pyridoxamine 5'-phosphate oxidase n=1 Tax=Bordetella avium (strain 197N) TaxID=360910 RepID=Q2L0K3_BORA1|nr:pyridoxamine 5'-phosphate oxidase family protein [Bordetella avium]AZY47876.1 pyridoxamine 5'-phosphate oxidase family protein [Bordetella avium]AZY51248.1 pyridoxamine 5'-phosphate oxidase family protein [Bordetella avium]RIQ14897.1 pyridoxamine 5'-phosphate oxidase family protein [Bordetella avium]RIQ18612.1 pyridoxamine 5'-phosphate oxidase family protein [Bordetella avium]RIQ35352.1 pyridoxamine 5'-phosphate oxidase family protein [Bordetella avium]
MTPDPRYLITDTQALAELYGEPGQASLAKELDYVHPHYRAFIEASPFATLATSGAQGLDASPRGDPAGFVVVENDRTLLLPDRRGNNRIDSLRNVLEDPRVALLFLIPGVGETLRVNGRAEISVDPALLARFAMDGKPARSVLILHVEKVYFQCARAIVRSGLWDPAKQVARDSLPSTGRMLADVSAGEIDGAAYDRDLPERMKKTLY